MPGKAINGVFQRIRALAAVHTSRTCSDRELLQRFLTADDEAAFTLLVERHGPMVQALCRRLLRDRHEADDACQAAFLVLARKARSVRKQESLASWLHGVAFRISLSLRRQRARRVRREQAASRPDVQAADDNLTWRELRAVLDEELERLPERYRAPLILCYLEGKTRDEAAQQLGAKPGALHGLLDRGRKLLRDRLSKRGLPLSAALFATALAESATRAALAPAVAVASARAALALVRGETIGDGLIGSQVLTLVTEASQAMFMTKLKVGAALVVAAGILTSVVGGSLSSVSFAQAPASQPKSSTPAATPQTTESDEEFIRRISKDSLGTEPSPTEVHFFVNNQDAGRRQKLIDLFIQERQAKERAAAAKKTTVPLTVAYVTDLNSMIRQQAVLDYVTLKPRKVVASRLITLQRDLFNDLHTVAKDKKEVAAITQKYLDQLQEYVKANPKNEDVPDAMHQISIIYRSQGKTVEADAWRDKLKKEHPQSPAAKALQQIGAAPTSVWVDFGYPAANQPFLNSLLPYNTNLNPSYLNVVPYNTNPNPSYFNTLQGQPSIYQPYINQNQFPSTAPKKDEKKEDKK